MPLNPIWDFYEKLPRDRSRAACKQCGKTYSLGSDVPKRQTLTGLKKHMKMHQDKHVLYLKSLADRDVERLAKRMKQECSDMDCSFNMFELQALADMQQLTAVNSLPFCPDSDVQNGDLEGIRLNCHCCYHMYFV